MSTTLPSTTATCSASEVTLGRSVRAVRLENDLLAAVVLVDQGADIYQLIYKPQQMDVLWKSPWGIREPGRSLYTSTDSVTAWLEAYAGGWQEIFPSGGGPCTYKSVELNFHGEASVIPWEYEIVTEGDGVELRLQTRLHRSPFRLERTMRVKPNRPVLLIQERISNEGGEALDYMWGHHPAYGAPFLSNACRIDIGARSLWADDEFDGPANPLRPDEEYPWPTVLENDGQQVDMAQVPGENEERHILAYFQDFSQGWYGITNRELGFGVGLVWPTDIFPYAWFWQEMNASPGFPWYKGAYVMAIEPFSSVPGQGLLAVQEKTGTQRALQPGESVEVEFQALFYQSNTGVKRIERDGTVTVKEE